MFMVATNIFTPCQDTFDQQFDQLIYRINTEILSNFFLRKNKIQI